MKEKYINYIECISAVLVALWCLLELGITIWTESPIPAHAAIKAIPLTIFGIGFLLACRWAMISLVKIATHEDED